MIETYHITTGMGKTNDSLPFLTPEQKEEFNHIGYSGKRMSGEPCSRQEYLNSLNIGNFKVIQTKFDDGSFQEKFRIIHEVEDNIPTTTKKEISVLKVREAMWQEFSEWLIDNYIPDHSMEELVKLFNEKID